MPICDVFNHLLRFPQKEKKNAVPSSSSSRFLYRGGDVWRPWQLLCDVDSKDPAPPQLHWCGPECVTSLPFPLKSTISSLVSLNLSITLFSVQIFSSSQYEFSDQILSSCFCRLWRSGLITLVLLYVSFLMLFVKRASRLNSTRLSGLALIYWTTFADVRYHCWCTFLKIEVIIPGGSFSEPVSALKNSPAELLKLRLSTL